MPVFQPATRKRAWARIALIGPSGSGKTWTALTFGTALGSRIALVDTEHGSAAKYAPPFTFGHAEINEDFHPKKIVDFLAAATDENHDVVIIDSWSHFWMGSGGMLEQVDRAAKRSYGGNQFGGWKEMRPDERRMVEAMLAFPGHLIVTLRTKTEYVVDTDDRGRKVPRKIGLKPEQRDGIEYEFDIVADMNLENEMIISKTRCPDLSKAVIKEPGEDVARTIAKWLQDGTASGPTAADIRDEILGHPAMTRAELREQYGRAERLRLLGAAMTDEHGDTTTLGEWITRRGREARDREARQSQPPAGDTVSSEAA